MVWNIPRSHDAQEVSPASLLSPLMPIPHCPHSLLFVSFDAYPAGHCRHDSVDVSTYCPAEQEEHVTLPTVEVRPGGHAPHVVFRSISFEKVFTAHVLHNGCPSSFWYSPGMQGKQYPVPLVGFFNPGRHFKQVVASSAPPRYSPSPQSSHPFVTEF